MTDKASTKFSNIVVLGNMNIDTLEHSFSLDKLKEFYDALCLHNLIQRSSSSVDLLFLQIKTEIKEYTCLWDRTKWFYKMVVTYFKQKYERLRPINIQYGRLQKFRQRPFLSKLPAGPSEELVGLPSSELAYEKLKSSKHFAVKSLKTGRLEV